MYFKFLVSEIILVYGSNYKSLHFQPILSTASISDLFHAVSYRFASLSLFWRHDTKNTPYKFYTCCEPVYFSTETEIAICGR